MSDQPLEQSHPSAREPYPSVRKRTKLEREKHLQKIASLDLEGRSQQEIAETLGLSKSQICRDLKAIRRLRQSEIGREDSHNWRTKELASIDRLEEMVRRAYERSCMTEEIQCQEKISSDPAPSVAGNTGKLQVGRLKASIRTKDRDGNPAFLKMIGECIKMRCNLQASTKGGMSGGRKMIELIEVNKTVESRDLPAHVTDAVPTPAPSPPEEVSPPPSAPPAPLPRTEWIGDRKVIIALAERPEVRLQRALAEFAEECGRQEFKLSPEEIERRNSRKGNS